MSRDDAQNELMNRLDTNKMFNLNVHPIRFVLKNKTLSTKAIAITGQQAKHAQNEGETIQTDHG
eukprot:10357052-Ditylum_brightwellii.AAC.1